MKKYELSPCEQKLFNDNLKLVEYTLYKFFSNSTIKGLGINEAKAVGCMGLVKAIKSYDPTKGTEFATHAVNTIRYEVLNALRFRVLPMEYECIENMRETELRGKIVGDCKCLLSVDYFTNYIDQVGDYQIVDRLHKIAERSLSDRYYQVYKMAYIDGMHPVEIAKEFNVSRGRIYGMLKKITFKLKERIKAEERIG